MDISASNFELRSSLIPEAGKGVFSLVDISTDSFLELKPKGATVGVLMPEEAIPAEYLHYCIAKQDGLWSCPRDFSDMELVWYLNHSDRPNAELRDDGYYSVAAIRSGDEILIDYNQFGEPEGKKEAFYRK